MQWWRLVFAVLAAGTTGGEARRFHPHPDAHDGVHRQQNGFFPQKQQGQQQFEEFPQHQDNPGDKQYYHNTIVVDESTGIRYNPYSKHHPGRHVCTNQRNASHPQKLRQGPYCKPTYKKYYVRCGNQLCAGVRLVYETHHKELTPKSASDNDFTYVCCPGWTQATNRSHGCNKPWTCPKPCLNGGTCVTSKGICACIKGFRGSFCEKDVDECKEYKPCDQICYNTPGSYNCQCRENFLLQTDGQSCRKEDDGETTIEAKDLEFEMLDKRLIKLETMMDESHKNDVTKNDLSVIQGDIDNISTNIKDLKTKMSNMEHYKSDMYIFKNKLNLIEKKANKIDDLLIKYEKMKKCAFYNKICI